MEITRILRRLWSMKILLVVGLIVALVASVLSAYRVTLSPFGLESRAVSYGAAATQVLVDTRRSSLASVNAVPSELAARAEVLSQFLGSAEAREQIARQMGVDANQILITSSPNTVQGQTRRGTAADQATAVPEDGTLSVTYQTQLGTPIIAITTRGPNADTAVRLANASAVSLRDQIALIGDRSGVEVKSPERVVLREVGTATGAQVSTAVDRVRTVMVFFVVFAFWCFACLGLSRLKQDWRYLAAVERNKPAASGQDT